MKRKRGIKKGKGKKPKAGDFYKVKPEVETVIVEDNAGAEEENDRYSNSGMEVDTPEPAWTDQAEKLSPEAVVRQKPVERKVQMVYERVRVKIKSAKPVESVPSSSGAATISETDRSGQEQEKNSREQDKISQEKEKSCQEQEKVKFTQVKSTSSQPDDMSRKLAKLKEQEVVTVEEDANNNSSPDIKLSALGNPPKKSGSIKRKSSKALTVLNSDVVSKSPSLVEEERTPPPKKQKGEKKESKYDKQELDSALAVIAKVMKMDAEPFNAPVDPVNLRIPDYFDVIDTPMDFGTICNNIQSGSNYKNSKDVFTDVQYIWDNCYKYNNKGDHIIDLMKKVKKNFTKYWQVAGLYNDQLQKNSGANSSQVRDGATSNQGKVHMNIGSSKAKMKKLPGFRCHKDECLCAVCVLKRRRIVKEGKNVPLSVENLTGTNDSNMVIDSKQEGASQAESPFGVETSSNPDLQNPDSDADMNGKVEESERQNTDHQPRSFNDDKNEKHAELNIQESFKNNQNGDGYEESFCPFSQPHEVAEPASLPPADAQKDTPTQLEDDPAIIQQQKEAEAKHRRIKMLTQAFNNPVLMELCGTLFPDYSTSIWCGLHSVVMLKKVARGSSIHTAIESLLK